MYVILNSNKLIVEICKRPRYVRRQNNGIVILCTPEDADAIYSDDSDTFWPLKSVGYLCDEYTLVEVEEIPASVVAGYYFYHAGEFYTTQENLTALHALCDADQLLVDHEYRLTVLEILTE